MANILGDGLEWLTGQLEDEASEPITIARGGVFSSANAVIGKKLLKITDAMGDPRMEWTDLDICVPAKEYDFGDGPTRPLRGDRVYVAPPYDDVQVFEVFPYGNEPCWRWSDPIRQTMMRVHLKHVATEPYGYLG